jgi:hypothetical protein
MSETAEELVAQHKELTRQLTRQVTEIVAKHTGSGKDAAASTRVIWGTPSRRPTPLDIKNYEMLRREL